MDVVPHRSIGPLRLGADEAEVERAIGRPESVYRTTWHYMYPTYTLAASFFKGRVLHISAGAYKGESFTLRGVEITGEFRDVERRLRAAEYSVVHGTPDQSLGDAPLFLPSDNVVLWSDDGSVVDNVIVVSEDYWAALMGPSTVTEA